MLPVSVRHGNDIITNPSDSDLKGKATSFNVQACTLNGTIFPVNYFWQWPIHRDMVKSGALYRAVVLNWLVCPGDPIWTRSVAVQYLHCVVCCCQNVYYFQCYIDSKCINYMTRELQSHLNVSILPLFLKNVKLTCLRWQNQPNLLNSAANNSILKILWF